MLQSMTGYGKKEMLHGQQTITLELEVCNSRFLEISLRLPEMLLPYEEEFKRQIGARLARGRVRGVLAINGNETTPPPLFLNTDLLHRYYSHLKEIARELELPFEVKLTDLLTLPDIFQVEPQKHLDEGLIAAIKTLLTQVLEEVVAMRQREGAFLAQDLRHHLQLISTKAQTIKEIAQQNRQALFSHYQKYLRELLGDIELDENRLLQEVAWMIKKLDITEECARLQSHLEQFEHFLRSDEPVGKKLNFLIQEMNREITTLGTKAENASVSHLVVDLKDELEKIREQIQNIL